MAKKPNWIIIIKNNNNAETSSFCLLQCFKMHSGIYLTPSAGHLSKVHVRSKDLRIKLNQIKVRSLRVHSTWKQCTNKQMLVTIVTLLKAFTEKNLNFLLLPQKRYFLLAGSSKIAHLGSSWLIIVVIIQCNGFIRLDGSNVCFKYDLFILNLLTRAKVWKRVWVTISQSSWCVMNGYVQVGRRGPKCGLIHRGKMWTQNAALLLNEETIQN